ncbi:response regulator transcription factor [Solwaraspora sp. WMMD406]|uniref:response regulator transcription factor n=1 Tax=Solwaraspora sp. WMMD406 TaxID=3016095 RepID=UPI002417E286|nr:response regulator transcription factor [Solwaraspora sp. WMMD406]MDG4763752.1 response regulator transcription factor [Solwaraspora sp. WMMD406]
MRKVLVCVRTVDAAQNINAAAARLGLSAGIRTAVSEPEVMLRLSERPAEIVLADTALARPDSASFTRRVLARSPGSVVVLFGAEDPQVASAAMAAGARGLIRGADDLVSVVAKTLLLLAAPGRAQPVMPAAPAVLAEHAAGGSTSQATAGGTGSTPVQAATGTAGPAAPVAATIGATTGTRPAAHPADAGGQTVVPNQRDDAAPATATQTAPVAESDGAAPAAGAAATPPAAGPAAAEPAGGAVQSGGPVSVGGPVLSGGPTSALRRIGLTERELQVLRGMAEGRSNGEIGRELFVSEDTVKTHARRLFRKLGARDRAHAVATGFRTGLVA